MKRITDKEKGIEIGYEIGGANAHDVSIATAGAASMADWKRCYLEELLEKEISSANEYYDRRLNQNQLDKHIGKVDLLADLLGIEFPFDKLHMAFATMD